MQPTFNTYTNSKGERILYCGAPNLELLEELSLGYGDIWHSSFEQGYKNKFKEVIYQSPTFWYSYDFDGLEECVSWRLNYKAFAIREQVWNTLGGFDEDYTSALMQGLAYAYVGLRFCGVVPIYKKGLFTSATPLQENIPVIDRYALFRKHYKLQHSVFMLFREGVWKPKELKAFFYAKQKFSKQTVYLKLPVRALEQLHGMPKVSYIIPTMYRQDYTVQLLEDLSSQTYLPHHVIVVDGTPEGERNENVYNASKYPFKVSFIWQQSKGSCKARNEAIALCEGDYIVFGDDDIRIPTDYIENHIRFIQTYQVAGCNGLDIKAPYPNDDLEVLAEILSSYPDRYVSGPTQMFNNANSCVKKAYVDSIGGNDENYDGGYGEDSDFGFSLLKKGFPILHNPYSVNLHLKPSSGGYRYWGIQAALKGKKRKTQPWEKGVPVKWIRPVPSPTIMYQLYKQYTRKQRKTYFYKYFTLYLFKGNIWLLPIRILSLPKRLLQFKKSMFYGKRLLTDK
ncbi:glycosyltransferase family 2 protein [Zhouia sp. PK063]|uniref:glycosyltransferase family 2 protein n=1 Tax=Zhouia sp. PK063 TaxID=3373602 RepID=UPI0037B718B6